MSPLEIAHFVLYQYGKRAPTWVFIIKVYNLCIVKEIVRFLKGGSLPAYPPPKSTTADHKLMHEQVSHQWLYQPNSLEMSVGLSNNHNSIKNNRVYKCFQYNCPCSDLISESCSFLEFKYTFFMDNIKKTSSSAPSDKPVPCIHIKNLGYWESISLIHVYLKWGISYLIIVHSFVIFYMINN